MYIETNCRRSGQTAANVGRVRPARRDQAAARRADERARTPTAAHVPGRRRLHGHASSRLLVTARRGRLFANARGGASQRRRRRHAGAQSARGAHPDGLDAAALGRLLELPPRARAHARPSHGRRECALERRPDAAPPGRPAVDGPRDPAPAPHQPVYSLRRAQRARRDGQRHRRSLVQVPCAVRDRRRQPQSSLISLSVYASVCV